MLWFVKRFGLIKEYAEKAAKQFEEYNSAKDTDLVVDNGGVSEEAMFALFKAGQSKRIWGELYKVEKCKKITFLYLIFMRLLLWSGH